MKKIFKIAILFGCMLIMAVGWTSVSFATSSIHDDPTKPIVVPDGPDSPVTGPTDNTYTGGPSDIVQRLGYDPENMETVDHLTVNLRLYDRITDVVDLGEKKNGVISYDLKGTKKITVKTDVLKGLEKSDVLVMIVNPDTGKVYLISPYEFDSENGSMSFETPSYGKFCIIQKLPIVVRDVHPEEYPNLEVAKCVKKVPGDKYIELKAWLKAFNINDDKLKVAKDYEVDIDDYDSANYVSDVAVQINRNLFSYKLSTRMWADLYQDVNECDWGRVLDYAGVDYDKEAIEKDPTKLTELDRFVLKKCFIYHVDAETGEVSIAFEPEISFDIVENGYDVTNKKVKNGLQNLEKDSIDLQMKRLDDVDNVDEVEDNVNHKKRNDLEDSDVDDTSLMDYVVTPVYAKPQDYYTEEQREILTFDVNDIDERNDKNLCMVMSSDQYLGMGPFVLLMPKEKSSPWWIWLILIILTLIAIIVIYKRIKSRRRQA